MGLYRLKLICNNCINLILFFFLLQMYRFIPFIMLHWDKHHLAKVEFLSFCKKIKLYYKLEFSLEIVYVSIRIIYFVNPAFEKVYIRVKFTYQRFSKIILIKWSKLIHLWPFMNLFEIIISHTRYLWIVSKGCKFIPL